MNIIEKTLNKLDQKLLSSYSVKKYNNYLGARINRRYKKFAQKCRDKYIQKGNDPINYQDSIIRNKGFTRVENVLDKSTANDISEKIGEYVDKREELESLHLRGAFISDPAPKFGQKVFDSIFNNEKVDRIIKNYFGSNYEILWLNCYRSFHTDEEQSSWRWHIDNTPTETLKMLVHFTDAGEKQGATRFLDWNKTKEFHDIGYRGQSDRLDSDGFSQLAKEHDIEYDPITFDTKASDVIIFDNNVLHKAEPPEKGLHRDISTIMMVPSKEPWKKRFDINELNRPPMGWYMYPEKKTGEPIVY